MNHNPIPTGIPITVPLPPEPDEPDVTEPDQWALKDQIANAIREYVDPTRNNEFFEEEADAVLAVVEPIEAERDALRAKVARVEALRDKWRDMADEIRFTDLRDGMSTTGAARALDAALTGPTETADNER